MSGIELQRRDSQPNTPLDDIEQQPDTNDPVADGPSGQSESAIEERAPSNRTVRCAPQRNPFHIGESCS